MTSFSYLPVDIIVNTSLFHEPNLLMVFVMNDASIADKNKKREFVFCVFMRYIDDGVWTHHYILIVL